MDFDEIDEDEDGHEITITVSFVVEAGEDHLAKYTEVLEKIQEAVPDSSDISRAIDMIPVDDEGEALF